MTSAHHTFFVLASLPLLVSPVFAGCDTRDEAAAPTTAAETETAGNEPAAGTSAGVQPGQPPAQAGRRGPPPGKPACPMQVPDTEVELEDMEMGGAMVFRTGDAAQVAELRERVHGMADFHNERHADGQRPRRGPGAGMGPGGGRGRGPGAGMGPGRGGGMGPPPPAIAMAVDVEGGARMELAAKDESDVEAVREHLKKHVERMQNGQCYWMGAGGS